MKRFFFALILTRWSGFAHDGSTYVESSSIVASVQGTIGTGRTPGQIDFQTMTDAATGVLTTAATIDKMQHLGIGAAPVSLLSVPKAPAAGNCNAGALANCGTVSIGGGYWDGSTAGKFVGSTSGTSIAVNEAIVGNFLDFQLAGVSKFSVSSTGLLTVADNISSGGTIRAGTFSSSGTNNQLTINSQNYTGATGGIIAILMSYGTFSNSSGLDIGVAVNPVVNQTSTAAFTALRVNTTETATGGGAQMLIDAGVGGGSYVSKFSVDHTGIITDPLIQSTTGQRYVCVTTTGVLVSSAAACVGT